MSSAILMSSDEKIISINGSAGTLEAVLTKPTSQEIPFVGIMCHPHPLHGGSMNNKVVHSVVKTFRDLGMNSIRFNYRGVGNSIGTFDNGIGETDDVLSVITWAQNNFPGYKICLAGFSFGAYVSLRAATQTTIKLLISVAPPVSYAEINGLTPSCPWIIVHGDNDELFPVQTVLDWLKTLPTNPEFIHISDASHFFHGKLLELRNELHKAINTHI